MQYLKIPKDRIRVLMGKKKKEIEKRAGVEIKLGEDSEVIVKGEPMNEWMGKDIVLAIGRGFSPENAFKLLSDENTLEIIHLREFCRTEKALRRKKARVIGGGGKAKRVIEELTGTLLSIYGNTIAIIGTYDGVGVAKEAIFKILDGAPHSTVYKFLEKNVHFLKRNLNPI